MWRDLLPTIIEVAPWEALNGLLRLARLHNYDRSRWLVSRCIYADNRIGVRLDAYPNGYRVRAYVDRGNIDSTTVVEYDNNVPITATVSNILGSISVTGLQEGITMFFYTGYALMERGDGLRHYVGNHLHAISLEGFDEMIARKDYLGIIRKYARIHGRGNVTYIKKNSQEAQDLAINIVFSCDLHEQLRCPAHGDHPHK